METTQEAIFESSIMPVMPLRDMVVFPNSITPLFVVRPRSLAAIDEAIGRDKRVFAALQKNMETESPGPGDLELVGTVCEVLQVLKVPDGSAKVLIEGSHVARAVEYAQSDRYLQALTVRVVMDDLKGTRGRAMMRVAMNLFTEYARLSEKIPDELLQTIQKIESPLGLANAIAHYSGLKTDDKQQILAATNVEEKFLLLHDVMHSENQILELEHKIFSQVKTQIGRSQREYFLNEQRKAIDRELGVDDIDDSEWGELKQAIEKAGMPKEVRARADKEFLRLTRMAPLSPEATVSRTYLEWLAELPWVKTTADRIDLARAKRILDTDHFGLEKVKERILEHLAVLQLSKTTRGPILCLVGPPGVGKTSLGRSIARCMGRKFVRVSLGGVRDEAEIRGHRRTYIGALPGKIIQHMRRAGVVNPVFLLDEVDKMASDFRGDPASALLEVLDPEQNKAFNDHYLEVDYDLRSVMFITTANTVEGIPLPLLDRMEVLRLPGYTEIEKKQIATRFLVPRQTRASGLKRAQVRFRPAAVRLLINGYTKEAGVRSLEREIANACRKIARRIVAKTTQTSDKTVVTAELVREFLGPIRYQDMDLERKPEVGVALGLAWTEFGGEVLPVETTVMAGKGNLALTGKLGEVMQESAKTALSYIRSHAKDLAIDPEIFKDSDIHVHIPEGAISKDGPSAGVTIAASMTSALSKREARQDIAMTGEVTLRGHVLKIGGLKEKALAAHRHGVRIVLVPSENGGELEEIPQEIRKQLEFIQVKNLSEVLALVVPKPRVTKKEAPPGKQRRPRVDRHRDDGGYVRAH